MWGCRTIFDGPGVRARTRWRAAPGRLAKLDAALAMRVPDVTHAVQSAAALRKP